MRHIYPPPFLKPALSVFMMFFAISFVKAQSIELGGKYANSQIGHYKYGAYYDVMADGTRLLGTATASMRAKFEWFNFDNDRYIDAYSPNYVWWGNETHVYNSSNCVLESKASYGYQAIDFNNDGRSDIKFGARYWYNGEYINNTKPEEVFVYAHGQWWPTRVRLLSMEEYRGEQEKMVLHSGTGLGSGMSIVSGSSTAMANSSTQAIDLNSDGYTDFVDAASGLFYQNLGDGRYVLN